MRHTGRRVEFKTETVNGTAYLASPEKHRGAVLVLHAWWGLNDFFKGFCDRLASHGFLALAPDLYGGAVAKSVSEAKELSSKDGGARLGIASGALDYLRSQQSQSGRKIGIVGFSMGAAYALWLSTTRPEDVAAVVVFYGTYPGLGFSKARASFLGHYAPEDEWEPTADVKAMELKIREAGREVTFHFYPGRKHWFFEEDRPDAYDHEAADLAWSRTLEFLNNKLP